MMEILEKVKNRVLDALFPIRCVGCGAEGQYVCERCEGFVSEAALICPACQQSSFTGERHRECIVRYGLDGFSCIWEYEGIVKKLLGAVKYRGVTHAVLEIIESAFQVMIRDKERFQSFLSFVVARDTVLTYVPMFTRKEKKRGFNQAQLIAKEIGRITGREVVSALAKTKDTPSQTDLDKEERLENVKDSFSFKEPSSSTKELGSFRNVVLADDVWTTGATMRECCRVLKKAGVQKVWGFTLARTP